MFGDPPLTKRQLGWLILFAGLAITLANLGVDSIGAGQFAQKQALVGGIALALFGLTLLPLGHRPA